MNDLKILIMTDGKTVEQFLKEHNSLEDGSLLKDATLECMKRGLPINAGIISMIQTEIDPCNRRQSRKLEGHLSKYQIILDNISLHLSAENASE